MKSWNRIAFFLIVTATAFNGSSANAATLIVNQGWKIFNFNGLGSSIIPTSGGGNSYEFTLSSNAYLLVTDGYDTGDQFELFNFGSSLGRTGNFTSSSSNISDPNSAFTSGLYSKGIFLLGAGSHSITGKAISSPYGGGLAFIALSSSVPGGIPEPATWAMMIGGLGAVGVALRRRQKAIVRFA